MTRGASARGSLWQAWRRRAVRRGGNEAARRRPIGSRVNRLDSVQRWRDSWRSREHGGTVRRAVRRIPQDRFAGRDEEDGKAMVAVRITHPLAPCRHGSGPVAMDDAVIPAFDAGGMNVLGTDDLQRQNRGKRGEQHDGTACARHVYGSSISRAGVETYDSGHTGR